MFASESSADRPILFCLHYLGGSARDWAQVARLVGRVRCVPLDLPGFGDAAQTPGYTIDEMVAHVADALRAHAPKRWMLAGHSMGAKVATALARRAEDGAPELAGLVGLVLVAGSPPSPEPMDDAQRATMLGMFRGDAAANRADAETYVAQNSESLDAASRELAVIDALRANPDAWRAWLESGSREDWSARVGTLRTPALVVAGADDGPLGPDGQLRLQRPHFENARSLNVAGAKHLVTLERPHELARAIDHFAVAAAYRALVMSDRVGARSRDALLARARPDDLDYAPVAIDTAALATLRAVLDRVVPQDDARRIDLAARIDTVLASGVGDGWRFAQLPPDVDAYRAALATLDDAARQEGARAFDDLDAARCDAMLARVAAGTLEAATVARTESAIGDDDAATAGRLNAAQMRAWFEDVRAEAVKAYLAHPNTLARMGYSGIANGGDGEPKTGFARIGIGEREAWEPIASHSLASEPIASEAVAATERAQ